MSLAAESFRQKLDDLETLIEETEQKCEDFEEEIKVSEERRKLAILEAENIRRKCASTKEEIRLATAKELKLKNKLVHLQSSVYKSDKSREELQKSEEKTSDQLDDVEKKLKFEREKHIEICGVFEEARSRKSLLESQLNKCIDQKSKQLEKKDILQKELDIKQKSLDSQNEEFDEEEAMDEMIEKVRQMQEKENELQDRIQYLRNQITMTTTDVSKQQKKKEDATKRMNQILAELDSI